MSESTKNKILQAIQELNYKPNILASRLKSAKKYKLAIIIPKATREIPFWSQHKRGFDKILEELSPFGLKLETLKFHQNDENSFHLQITKALTEQYDGILMVPVFYNETLRLLKHCNLSATPVIFFDSMLSNEESLSFIGQHSEDSGFLAANLLNESISINSKILIATVVKKEDNHFQFAAREHGFRNFFKTSGRSLLKIEFNNEDASSIKSYLQQLLEKEPNIEGIFATNGIHKIAGAIDQLNLFQIKLIGYDLIKENIYYLKKGTIRYLISQQPDKQAYLGIKLLYEYLILKQPIKKTYYLPLDIVMKSNVDYYLSHE